MIRCIAIDDEKPAINVLKKYIARLPNLQLIGYETNPILGIEMVKREKPELVFMDVHMDEMSGMDVAKIIGNTSSIIFCTAYSEFAVTSYDHNAIDYLMKPIEFQRFVKAIQRLSDLYSNQITANGNIIARDYIFIKTGQKGKMLKIDLDDIDFVEAMNNYLAFHRDGNKTLAYLTLKDVEARLPPSQFIRVHKSFVVSFKEILSIDNNQILLKKGQRRIPIGANYKEYFLNRLKENLLSCGLIFFFMYL